MANDLEDNKLPSSDKIKELHNITQKYVKENKESLINNIPEIKAFKKILLNNPDLAYEYFSKLDAINPEKVNNVLKNINIKPGQKKVITFDDGSFIVLRSNIIKKGVKDKKLNIVTNSATEDFQYDIWGVYKAAELHLITDYNYDRYSVEITDVDETYWTVYPTGCIDSSSEILDSGGMDGKKRAEFDMVEYVVGYPAIQYQVTLNTTITNLGDYDIDIENTYYDPMH